MPKIYSVYNGVCHEDSLSSWICCNETLWGTTDKSHNCQKPEAELNEIYISIIKQKHQAPMKSDSHKEVSSHADEIPRGQTSPA